MRKFSPDFVSSLLNFDSSTIDLLSYSISELLSSVSVGESKKIVSRYDEQVNKIANSGINPHSVRPFYSLSFTSDSPFINVFELNSNNKLYTNSKNIYKFDHGYDITFGEIVPKSLMTTIEDVGSIYRMVFSAINFAKKLRSVKESASFLTFINSDMLIEFLLFHLFGFICRRFVPSSNQNTNYILNKWFSGYDSNLPHGYVTEKLVNHDGVKVFDVIVKTGELLDSFDVPKEV